MTVSLHNRRDPYTEPTVGPSLALLELGERVRNGLTFENACSVEWAEDQITVRAKYGATQ